MRIPRQNEILIHNDFIDEVENNIDEYDDITVMNIAVRSIHKYRMLNHLWLRSTLEGHLTDYVRNLDYLGELDGYFTNIEQGNDKFMKAFVGISGMPDIIDDNFKNYDDVMDALSNEGNYNAMFRLLGLELISINIVDNKIMKKVKNRIKRIVLKSLETNEITEEKANELIDFYDKMIDDNQKTLTKEYTLTITK